MRVLKKLQQQSANMFSYSNILTKEVNNKALVILNRPQRLNAFNQDLLQELNQVLRIFTQKKSLIIIKGAGDRALSSGGDIADLYEATKNPNKALQMIHDLHSVLMILFTSKIPVVTIMNGFTFGSGVGLSYFSKYRIATEKTVFSMPEIKIAYHPNAGASIFMNKLVGKLGYYLALTGSSIKSTDVFNAGFATHYCLSENIQNLEESILSGNSNVDNIINNICEKNVPTFSLSPIMNDINEYFSADSVEDLFLRLEKSENQWAKNQLVLLRTYSPVVLKVILRQLQRGSMMSTAPESLDMEYNLTRNFFRSAHVSIGLKALMEKTNMPKWIPSTLEEATEERVERYFRSIPDSKHDKIIGKVNSKI